MNSISSLIIALMFCTFMIGDASFQRVTAGTDQLQSQFHMLASSLPRSPLFVARDTRATILPPATFDERKNSTRWFPVGRMAGARICENVHVDCLITCEQYEGDPVTWPRCQRKCDARKRACINN
ncbi:MAG: hypothetical protein ACI9XZ_004282 [Alphaproteobacteria bacterium]|jgi:hypothetical protein